MERWQLVRGDVLVGELREHGFDQPFVLADFSAGPGWEEVGPLFEAASALHGKPDPDGTEFLRVMTPLRDLGLVLVCPDGLRPSMKLFTQCLLWIDGTAARMRY